MASKPLRGSPVRPARPCTRSADLYTFPSDGALLGGVSSGPLSCPDPSPQIARPSPFEEAASSRRKRELGLTREATSERTRPSPGVKIDRL